MAGGSRTNTDIQDHHYPDEREAQQGSRRDHQEVLKMSHVWVIEIKIKKDWKLINVFFTLDLATVRLIQYKKDKDHEYRLKKYVRAD